MGFSSSSSSVLIGKKSNDNKAVAALMAMAQLMLMPPNSADMIKVKEITVILFGPAPVFYQPFYVSRQSGLVPWQQGAVKGVSRECFLEHR